MTAASYKFDHGQKSYPTNKCFPARTFLHRRKEGELSQSWLFNKEIELYHYIKQKSTSRKRVIFLNN